jgi:hypothetical protein
VAHVLSHAFTANTTQLEPTRPGAGPDKVFTRPCIGKDVVPQAFRSSVRSTSQLDGFDQASPMVAVQTPGRKLRNHVEHLI